MGVVWGTGREVDHAAVSGVEREASIADRGGVMGGALAARCRCQRLMEATRMWVSVVTGELETTERGGCAA